MTEITAQEWCDIAKEVHLRPKGLEYSVAADNKIETPFDNGVSWFWEVVGDNVHQNIKIADYLAEKGVFVLLDENSEDGNYVCIHWFRRLSEHKEINMCRALAVLALIKEGK